MLPHCCAVVTRLEGKEAVIVSSRTHTHTHSIWHWATKFVMSVGVRAHKGPLRIPFILSRSVITQPSSSHHRFYEIQALLCVSLSYFLVVVNFNRTLISSDLLSTSVQLKFHIIIFKPWNNRRFPMEPSSSLSFCRCVVWSCRSVSLALHVPSYNPVILEASDVTVLTCFCLRLETKQDALLFKGFFCACALKTSDCIHL